MSARKRCNGGCRCSQSHTVDWREPDDEPEITQDRDTRTTQFAKSKAKLREKLAPRTPGGHRNNAWGGGMRRMVATVIAPSREDTERFISVPGRYVPIGFARYVSPVIDPSDYEMYRVAGWQIAVPRSIPGERVKDLLDRIFYYGPQSAGYVRIGDVMTPAILGPGDRMTLAGSTDVEYETYPLSP